MASRFGMGMSITPPPGFPGHGDHRNNNWGGPFGRSNLEVFQEEDEDQEDGDVETFKVAGAGCACCTLCPAWLGVLCILFVIFVCLAAIVVPVALTQRSSLVTFGNTEDILTDSDKQRGTDNQNDLDPTKTPLITKMGKPTSTLSSITTLDDATVVTELTTGITTEVTSPPSTKVQSTTMSIDLTHYYNSTSFIYFSNTRSHSQVSSTLLPEAMSLKQCEKKCVESSPMCFGLDYDKTSEKCYLIMEQVYILQTSGSVPDWQHERRDVQASSICRYEPTQYYNAPAPTEEGERQPSNIDTSEKCNDACAKTFMPSGKHCAIAAFNNNDKACYLFDEEIRTIQSWRWDFFRFYFNCYFTFAPYRVNTFKTVRGTFPADILPEDRQPLTQVINFTSVVECAEESCKQRFRNSGQPTCGDFIYDEVEERCSLVLRIGSNYNMTGKFYYRGTTAAAAECKKEEKSENMAGRATTKETLTGSGSCKEKCRIYGRDNDGGRCYGYDISTEEGCVGILRPNYELGPSNITTNYRRNLLCEAAPHPYFISTINTLPPGGKTLASTDIKDCASQCVQSTHPMCYGFAFNYVTLVCHHFRNFNYDLGRVGFHPGIVHFRRQFKQDYIRPNQCEERFTTVMDASVLTPGLPQPWDINTEERCKDRCIGLSLATQQVCYGVDFNTTINACTLHTVQTRASSLAYSPGVYHYTRNKVCDLLL